MHVKQTDVREMNLVCAHVSMQLACTRCECDANSQVEGKEEGSAPLGWQLHQAAAPGHTHVNQNSPTPDNTAVEDNGTTVPQVTCARKQTVRVSYRIQQHKSN